MNFNHLSDIAMKMKKSEKFKMALGMAAVVTIGAGVATVVICAARSDKDMRNRENAINISGTFKNTFQKKADKVKHSAAVTADEVCRIFDDVHGKIESVKKDIADGRLKIMRDIHEISDNVSGELKKK